MFLYKHELPLIEHEFLINYYFSFNCLSLFHFRHLERGGVGRAILALAQGGPLHHTVFYALYLPPLAVFYYLTVT